MSKIQEYLKQDGGLNLSKLTKSHAGKELLASLTQKFGEARASQLAYREHYDVQTLPLCKNCGTQLTALNFIDFVRGYRSYCSNSCSSKHNGSAQHLVKMVHTDEFKERRRKAIINRYGTDSMIDINREKAAETSMKKYGVDNPLKSPKAQLWREAYFIKKYGVDNPWKLEDVQTRCKDTLEREYGVRDPLKLVDWSTINVTKGHQAILDHLLELVPDEQILVNDRTLIAPYEVDLYLPALKLAIEYNGTYWHAAAAGKDSAYHLAKTDACAIKGVRLIHVFEDELLLRPEVVKSRLQHILGMSTRVYARNCRVVSLTSSESDEFMERCHTQGKARASRRYGLIHDEKLVAVMTFSVPRFNKNYDWELVRYATELGVTVVGGAGKLLKAFRESYSGSIISYADRRWSQGGLYRSIGFNEVRTTKPGYSYVNLKTGMKVSRTGAQKHRLDQLLEDKFDSTKTEIENMSLAGFRQIFDCGHYVFELL